MIDEHRFRALCCKEMGGIEGERFQKALDDPKYPDADPVAVAFDVGIDEQKVILLPRDEANDYARIAREERAPEEELLKHIKPEAHTWVKYNRSKMISILQEKMLQLKEEMPMARVMTIVWPLWTPDVIQIPIAEAYVRKYS